VSAHAALRARPCYGEETRLGRLWIAKLDEAKRCTERDGEEFEIRKAEYLAACQRCAIKERCEKTLEHDLLVVATKRAFAEGAVPAEARREAEAETETRSLGHDKYRFGCE